MKYEMLWTEPLLAAPFSQLDLFALFTTPEPPLAAVRAAASFGRDPYASIRLVKMQMAPFHLPSSPVDQKFVQGQLECIEAELPMHRFAVFTSEFDRRLLAMLGAISVVVLALRRRFWRTSTEALAGWSRSNGHRVILVQLMGAKEFVYA